MKYLKQYKLFESKNLTTQIHEKVLNEYFEFTSDEIKEWCGDILDEYPELDFEVLVAKRN